MQNSKPSPLVAIWMVTYNHQGFIEKAVDSIMAQKTSFKYELYIGEDCSTDRTREICIQLKRKYSDKITLILKEHNVGSIQNACNVYEACFLSGAKYIALCEGDDYWTDPFKLQKQVDYLEANPDYSICWTKYKIREENNPNIEVLHDPSWLTVMQEKEGLEISLNNIFFPYTTHAVTVLLVIKTFDLEMFKNLKHAKDDTIYCMCLSKGKGKVLNFFSSVYRVHNNSTYSSLPLFNKRYSNFCTLEEIIKNIKDCNTHNLVSFRNIMLQDAFSLSTSMNYSFATSLNLYSKILIYSKPKEKVKASGSIIRCLAQKIFKRF